MEEKKLNILIADDEEGLRFSLASILEIEGHNVLTAENGLQALDLVKNTDFDIAFLDIRMPEMNGVEVFKEIKKINTKTIVVMMTAYAMNDLIREAIKEGAFACISKPFEIEDILNTVKEINTKPSALIVSSDNETINFLVSNLRHSGVMSIIEENLEKALMFADRRKPSLIFFDSFSHNISRLCEEIKEISYDTKVMLIGDSNLRIEKAEVIAKPVTKAAIAEFLKPAVKGKIAIISSDTLKSNNLKLSILAKGYDVIYFPLMDKFLNSAELNTFNVIISETGIITELENLCRKVNSGDISGQLIGILDYEIPIPENMINKKIKFLQNPFELSELFKIIEE